MHGALECLVGPRVASAQAREVIPPLTCDAVGGLRVSRMATLMVAFPAAFVDDVKINSSKPWKYWKPVMPFGGSRRRQRRFTDWKRRKGIPDLCRQFPP